jgi:hypothetical protein
MDVENEFIKGVSVFTMQIAEGIQTDDPNDEGEYASIHLSSLLVSEGLREIFTNTQFAQCIDAKPEKVVSVSAGVLLMLAGQARRMAASAKMASDLPPDQDIAERYRRIGRYLEYAALSIPEDGATLTLTSAQIAHAANNKLAAKGPISAHS